MKWAPIPILLTIISSSTSFKTCKPVQSRRNINGRKHLDSSMINDQQSNPKWISRTEKVSNLRSMLTSHRSSNNTKTIIMPCCYDGLTAKLIENSGFDLTFMTGFGVSATYGLPDAGLLGSAEMLHNGATICNVLQSIPCIGAWVSMLFIYYNVLLCEFSIQTNCVCVCVVGDADTGYGNEINTKRTVKQYAQMGFAGLMIEDQVSVVNRDDGIETSFINYYYYLQVSPKRCGHVSGKQVISRDDAALRVAAAVQARNEGEDIVILARTDGKYMSHISIINLNIISYCLHSMTD